MQKTSNAFNYWRHLTSSKLLISSLFVLAVTISVGALLYQHQTVLAASCSDNDIIRCGVSNASDLRDKMNANQAGDLQAIYAHYGIEASEVASQAVEGTAYRDGTIRVNNKVVATNASSLGRSQKSYSNPITISGNTYHESASGDVFNSDALEVLVVMDGDNRFQYAVIKECGNPAKATPVEQPREPTPPPAKSEPKEEPKSAVFECRNIRAIRVDENDDDSERTYQFAVRYRADNNAELRDVDFNFGDQGTQNGVSANADSNTTITSENVTFNTPGEKNISATLHFNVDGRVRDVSGEDCATTINIPKPNDVKVCRHGEIITVPENERRNDDLSQSSNECKTGTGDGVQATLPSTGPGEVIGSAVGIGSMAGAGYYLRASRRNLLGSILKK